MTTMQNSCALALLVHGFLNEYVSEKEVAINSHYMTTACFKWLAAPKFMKEHDLLALRVVCWLARVGGVSALNFSNHRDKHSKIIRMSHYIP